MYEYKVKILKIVDGDTVDVDIDLGFNIIMKDQRVRIIGIDTPESRTTDPIEKLFGIAAKNKLQEIIGEEDSILKTFPEEKDKFGRILGDFVTKNGLASKILIEEGYGVEYSGGNKEELYDKHRHNRIKLITENRIVLHKHNREKLLNDMKTSEIKSIEHIE